MPGTDALSTERSRADILKVYALAVTTAVFAEKNCTGVEANQIGLAKLRSYLKITDAEEPLLTQFIREEDLKHFNSLKSQGSANWCSTAWSLFGAQGSVAKDLILRK